MLDLSKGTTEDEMFGWHHQLTDMLLLLLLSRFSHVRLFATLRTEARQASLSLTNSRSLFKLMSIGEGNGTPLQYSCLENPKDRGAW